MILSTFHLFSNLCQGMSQFKHELDRPLLRNIFTLNSLEMLLTLTENYIFIAESANQHAPTHYLSLSFEVKFEILYQPMNVFFNLFRIKIHLEFPMLLGYRENVVPNS